MGAFLPSEVARLVLGYLEEQNCMIAYEKFLKQSPHLEECRGRGFFTRIMGLSLSDILDEYCEAHAQILNIKCASNFKMQLVKCPSLLGKVKLLVEGFTKCSQETPKSSSVPGRKRSDSCESVISIKSEKSNDSEGREGRAKRTSSKRLSKRHVSPIRISSPDDSSAEATNLADLPGNTAYSKECSFNSSKKCSSSKNKPTPNVTPDNRNTLIRSKELSGTQLSSGGKKLSTSIHQEVLSKSLDGALPSNVAASKSIVLEPDEVDFRRALGLIKHSELLENKTLLGLTPMKRKHLPIRMPASAKKTPHTEGLPNESLNVTTITNAMLDCTELHAKIAENINKYLNSTKNTSELLFNLSKAAVGDSCSVMAADNVLSKVTETPAEEEAEQLNTVIQAIVEKTEKDPLFDQLLDDVLVASLNSTSGSDSDVLSRPGTSTPEKSARSTVAESSPTSCTSAEMRFFSKKKSKKHKYQKLAHYNNDNRSSSSTTKTPNLNATFHQKDDDTKQTSNYPRVSRGGKKMELLKENYLKSNINEMFEDDSMSTQLDCGKPVESSVIAEESSLVPEEPSQVTEVPTCESAGKKEISETDGSAFKPLPGKSILKETKYRPGGKPISMKCMPTSPEISFSEVKGLSSFMTSNVCETTENTTFEDVSKELLPKKSKVCLQIERDHPKDSQSIEIASTISETTLKTSDSKPKTMEPMVTEFRPIAPEVCSISPASNPKNFDAPQATLVVRPTASNFPPESLGIRPIASGSRPIEPAAPLNVATGRPLTFYETKAAIRPLATDSTPSRGKLVSEVPPTTVTTNPVHPQPKNSPKVVILSNERVNYPTSSVVQPLISGRNNTQAASGSSAGHIISFSHLNKTLKNLNANQEKGFIKLGSKEFSQKLNERSHEAPTIPTRRFSQELILNAAHSTQDTVAAPPCTSCPDDACNSHKNRRIDSLRLFRKNPVKCQQSASENIAAKSNSNSGSETEHRFTSQKPVGSKITEADIMKMPTVLINAEGKVVGSNQFFAAENLTHGNNTIQTVIELQSELSENEMHQVIPSNNQGMNTGERNIVCYEKSTVVVDCETPSVNMIPVMLIPNNIILQSVGPVSESFNEEIVTDKSSLVDPNKTTVNVIPDISTETHKYLKKNTPDHNIVKKLSSSTPRKNLSHVRVLEFTTPDRNTRQSVRRANTSPKHLSRLAPHTEHKSNSVFPVKSSSRNKNIKSCLFQAIPEAETVKKIHEVETVKEIPEVEPVKAIPDVERVKAVTEVKPVKAIPEAEPVKPKKQSDNCPALVKSYKNLSSNVDTKVSPVWDEIQGVGQIIKLESERTSGVDKNQKTIPLVKASVHSVEKPVSKKKDTEEKERANAKAAAEWARIRNMNKAASWDLALRMHAVPASAKSPIPTLNKRKQSAKRKKSEKCKSEKKHNESSSSIENNAKLLEEALNKSSDSSTKENNSVNKSTELDHSHAINSERLRGDLELSTNTTCEENSLCITNNEEKTSKLGHTSKTDESSVLNDSDMKSKNVSGNEESAPESMSNKDHLIQLKKLRDSYTGKGKVATDKKDAPSDVIHPVAQVKKSRTPKSAKTTTFKVKITPKHLVEVTGSDGKTESPLKSTSKQCKEKDKKPSKDTENERNEKIVDYFPNMKSADCPQETVASPKVTPDESHLNISNFMRVHSYDLSTLLDTPFKKTVLDFSIDTPKFLSPANSIGLISAIKMLDLPTPSFMDTPSAPTCKLPGKDYTPASFSSRPTDYSSSSSYYKPDEVDDVNMDLTPPVPPQLKTSESVDKKDAADNVSPMVLRPRKTQRLSLSMRSKTTKTPQKSASKTVSQKGKSKTTKNKGKKSINAKLPSPAKKATKDISQDFDSEDSSCFDTCSSSSDSSSSLEQSDCDDSKTKLSTPLKISNYSIFLSSGKHIQQSGNDKEKNIEREKKVVRGDESNKKEKTLFQKNMLEEKRKRVMSKLAEVSKTSTAKKNTKPLQKVSALKRKSCSSISVKVVDYLKKASEPKSNILENIPSADTSNPSISILKKSPVVTITQDLQTKCTTLISKSRRKSSTPRKYEKNVSEALNTSGASDHNSEYIMHSLVTPVKNETICDLKTNKLDEPSKHIKESKTEHSVINKKKLSSTDVPPGTNKKSESIEANQNKSGGTQTQANAKAKTISTKKLDRKSLKELLKDFEDPVEEAIVEIENKKILAKDNHRKEDTQNQKMRKNSVSKGTAEVSMKKKVSSKHDNKNTSSKSYEKKHPPITAKKIDTKISVSSKVKTESNAILADLITVDNSSPSNVVEIEVNSSSNSEEIEKSNEPEEVANTTVEWDRNECGSSDSNYFSITYDGIKRTGKANKRVNAIQKVSATVYNTIKDEEEVREMVSDPFVELFSLSPFLQSKKKAVVKEKQGTERKKVESKSKKQPKKVDPLQRLINEMDSSKSNSVKTKAVTKNEDIQNNSVVDDELNNSETIKTAVESIMLPGEECAILDSPVKLSRELEKGEIVFSTSCGKSSGPSSQEKNMSSKVIESLQKTDELDHTDNDSQDLFSFALTCSADSKTTDKRKREESEGDSSDSKKAKSSDPQAFLKQLDIESILSKLHGPKF